MRWPGMLLPEQASLLISLLLSLLYYPGLIKEDCFYSVFVSSSIRYKPLAFIAGAIQGFADSGFYGSG